MNERAEEFLRCVGNGKGRITDEDENHELDNPQRQTETNKGICNVPALKGEHQNKRKELLDEKNSHEVCLGSGEECKARIKLNLKPSDIEKVKNKKNRFERLVEKATEITLKEGEMLFLEK